MASYFMPMKINPKKQNPSNNITQMNRFLAKIIKVKKSWGPYQGWPKGSLFDSYYTKV